jgi:hypothetical protein
MFFDKDISTVVNGVNSAGNDEEDDGLVLFLVMFRDETTNYD